MKIKYGTFSFDKSEKKYILSRKRRLK